MIEPDTSGDSQAAVRQPSGRAAAGVASLRTRKAVRLEWMVRRDMREVLEIDRLSFDCPWSELDYLRTLLQSSVTAMVARRGGRVVGFMVYRFDATDSRRKRIELIRLAVHPAWRDHGFGRQMVRRLIGRLTARFPVLSIPVPESNLPAQTWLRACGVRAGGVSRGHFEHGGRSEDAYVFEVRTPAPITSIERGH